MIASPNRSFASAAPGCQPSFDQSLGEPAPAPAPAAPALDPIEALTQAKKLLDAGVLTQEEFDAQKARILGG